MKETRNCNELITSTSRIVEGYALVFDSLSQDLGGFKEKISRDALSDVLPKSDILCLLNHNQDRGVLARNKYGEGSLELQVDDIGLRYRFEAPNTALGDELLEGLRRGDITSSSFAFAVKQDTWTKDADGSYIRTIDQFERLFDVSPVYTPAYEATTVQLSQRCLDMVDTLKKTDKDLENYYNTLTNKLNGVAGND